jgi:glycosyltransferase involved in cell wall biosynthesis
MRAKVVHDDLNAGGGSERLAIATISLLAEMGFKVDLASFKKPDIEQLKRDFGDIANSIDVTFKPLEFLSMLGLKMATAANPSESNAIQDNEYDLIINTHGDLLPYYPSNQTTDSNIITYCHFPVAPHLIEQGQADSYTRFIKRWTEKEDIETSEELKKETLEKVLRTYDFMIRNTAVVTNSNFSKKAIEERYGTEIKPTVVYPPVDVEKFRRAALHSNKRENAILVVSRFSPDKQLENTIEITKILVKDMDMQVRTVLVGNIASGDEQYLDKLRQLIKSYNLDSSIHIEVDASFDRLLELMRQSKIYLHPLAGEPFGISIVEAMSAGLIPVVPDQGGYTEFVPEYYQFHTHQQAADVIGKILIASDNDLQAERDKISESISKFSIESYKAGLRSVIESLTPLKGSSRMAAEIE